MNHFSALESAEDNNNNVNRRFAGRELKTPVAAGDDETNRKAK
jgi:hypothetical protein